MFRSFLLEPHKLQKYNKLVIFTSLNIFIIFRLLCVWKTHIFWNFSTQFFIDTTRNKLYSDLEKLTYEIFYISAPLTINFNFVKNEESSSVAFSSLYVFSVSAPTTHLSKYTMILRHNNDTPELSTSSTRFLMAHLFASYFLLR